jgi:hypothetical protein
MRMDDHLFSLWRRLPGRIFPGGQKIFRSKGGNIRALHAGRESPKPLNGPVKAGSAGAGLL